MNEYLSDSVKPETHGFRDESISRRHRLWGFNCPAADLDFLAVEYNIGRPVALVEYKYYLAKMPDLNHATYRAIKCLADEHRSGPLPFILAFYSRDDWSFRVYSVNEASEKYFRSGEHLSEHDYVSMLYRMRRTVLTNHIAKNLHTEIKDNRNVSTVSAVNP